MEELEFKKKKKKKDILMFTFVELLFRNRNSGSSHDGRAGRALII